MYLTDPPETDSRAHRDEQGRSQKIHPRHIDRQAIVYIRQSSIAQVHRNQESTRMQYGLVDAAKRHGWAQERILVIDEDLGLSGSTAVGREGFQKMLAEVALDHVGIIFGIEMSRLARSNKDWHQLLELCARFGVLIADLDGLYDPSLYNDRLLLGLKGTMSEAELHILRQRLLQGKLQKARRGELGMPVPTGYLRRSTGEVELDPDEEVQAVVRLIFDTFERTGTTQSVLRALAQSKTQIGVRLRTGPDIGQLVWRRPQRGMINQVLRNPIYAGAYVYGRRRTDPRRQTPGRPASGRTGLLPPGKWEACLRDRLPAYITWERFLSNQERIKQNRTNSAGPGPIGGGSALLQGLVVCGHCGYRMGVLYGQGYARYVCNHAAAARGEPVCCGLSASKLDDVVTDFALSALAPGALDVSLRVAGELERERESVDALWKKRLERAHYESERAERQYAAVEPENRLVARTLEKNWEARMQAERDLREEYERHRAQLPRCLSESERASIRALAHDLPELWKAPTTTPANRKAVLRHLIEVVTVTIDRGTEWMDVVIRWAGGHETQTRRRRPVARLSQMEGHEKLIEEIHALRRAGYTAERIAEKLNADGWVTPMQRNTFNARLIRAMIERHGFVPRGPLAPPTDDPNDWRLADLARELEMPLPTLYTWMRRGWLNARQVRGKWLVLADQEERERLRRLRHEHPNTRHARDSRALTTGAAP